MPMSAVIGCKLGKLDWNKTQRQNAFYNFFSFLPYFWYPVNTEMTIYRYTWK